MSTSDTSKSSPQNLQARSASSGSASAEHPLPQPLKPPKRIARTILAALKGGVVPRIGLGWIAVGRRLEIEALLNDMEVVRDGGASFRFIVGRYGAGKSFLLQTLRTYVMERGFVVADADLSPERRLAGTKGQGLATYRELVQNFATKTMPEGGALGLILERWMAGLRAELAAEGVQPGTPEFLAGGEAKILERMHALGEVLHGYEFSQLLIRYFRAMETGEDEVRARVVKWLRGEYPTRAQAKAELGINLVVSDDNWYDFLKLFALFLRGAGYEGLLILIDELVNLYKIPNSVSRQNNYEKILTIYNDMLQGRARGLGVIMSGTPQAVEDQRRGIFSYEALRSRLAAGRFSQDGRRDMMAPVIELEPLTPDELLVLIDKLAHMHADLFATGLVLSDQALARFLELEYDREGAATHLTPREIIRDFIEALNILAQNPDLTVDALFGTKAFQSAEHSEGDGEAEDEYAEFNI